MSGKKKTAGPAPVVVRFENVSLTIRPWQGGWRFSWRDGTRLRWVSRSTVGKAKDAALATAKRIARGLPELDALSADEITALRRIAAAGVSDALATQFLEWHAAGHGVTVGAAVDAFMAAKRAAAGPSTRNTLTLSGHLTALRDGLGADAVLSRVAVGDLDGLLTGYGASARSKRNRRNAWSTFFRWCRRRGWVPDGITAAEQLETPKTVRTVPDTYTPAEMKRMLAACPPAYLPWLVLEAFAGVRTAELFPTHGSKKPPLEWRDVDLGRGLLTVRPETSKTGERRVVELPAGIGRIFATVGSGRICPKKPPTQQRRKLASVTAVLGQASGRGWLANGLRNSFLSYRSALVGVAQAAAEAGNSENVVRQNYRDAKSRADAVEWFALVGGYADQNVVRMSA